MHWMYRISNYDFLLIYLSFLLSFYMIISQIGIVILRKIKKNYRHFNIVLSKTYKFHSENALLLYIFDNQ